MTSRCSLCRPPNFWRRLNLDLSVSDGHVRLSVPLLRSDNLSSWCMVFLWRSWGAALARRQQSIVGVRRTNAWRVRSCGRSVDLAGEMFCWTGREIKTKSYCQTGTTSHSCGWSRLRRHSRSLRQASVFFFIVFNWFCTFIFSQIIFQCFINSEDCTYELLLAGEARTEPT